MRYIRWRHGGTRYELLTNVLAPARLAAAEALALYPYRWRIERMYFDLKEVLNLNRIYAANPNAVAMQVYAAGIVYNALRVAQEEVAAPRGLPEEISPAKFFPKMVAACQTYVVAQQWERRLRRRHPRPRFRMIDWRTERWASVAVSAAARRDPLRPAAGAATAPRGATGSRSLMSVVVDNSRSYLSGDDP